MWFKNSYKVQWLMDRMPADKLMEFELFFQNFKFTWKSIGRAFAWRYFFLSLIRDMIMNTIGFLSALLAFSFWHQHKYFLCIGPIVVGLMLLDLWEKKFTEYMYNSTKYRALVGFIDKHNIHLDDF